MVCSAVEFLIVGSNAVEVTSLLCVVWDRLNSALPLNRHLPDRHLDYRLPVVLTTGVDMFGFCCCLVPCLQ